MIKINKGYFITGTDTGVGKTLVSTLIMARLKSEGRNTKYFKPVQTGTDSDTQTVRDLVGLSPVEFIPPVYQFDQAISPNRAAKLNGATIDIENCVRTCRGQAGDSTLVIEGAGGLLVPLGENSKIRDLALAFDLPLIIVSSTRLGTINHTLLTVESARAAGLKIAGIVLNGPKDPGLKETLEQQTAVPVLAEMPQIEKISTLAIQHLATTLFDFVIRRGEIDAAEASEENAHTVDQRRSLIERDDQTVWHPYTQHGLKIAPVPVVRGNGAYLELEDGRRIIDGISSWWVNLLGHGHPEIADAIARQSKSLEHVIFSGFTHEPAVTLAETLIDGATQVGAKFSKVFYSDNGSTAVEAALKMAYQFHITREGQARPRFIALRNAYHGDTFGAMAVGEPEGFHSRFRALLPAVDFVEPGDLETLVKLLSAGPRTYAAFIFEPVVQGAAGMREVPSDFLRQAVEFCRVQGVLTIADEVFTGFYRTGTRFAIESVKIAPDFLCLSKGITGGFLPLAATLVTDHVYRSFLSKDMKSAFLHGHSYTANPIACAAALASWKILHQPATLERIERISVLTRAHLSNITRNNPNIRAARSFGTIGAIELDTQATYMTSPSAIIASEAIRRGVLIRPLGNVLYAVPPYCTTDSELSRIYGVIEELSELAVPRPTSSTPVSIHDSKPSSMPGSIQREVPHAASIRV